MWVQNKGIFILSYFWCMIVSVITWDLYLTVRMLSVCSFCWKIHVLSKAEFCFNDIRPSVSIPLTNLNAIHAYTLFSILFFTSRRVFYFIHFVILSWSQLSVHTLCCKVTCCYSSSTWFICTNFSLLVNACKKIIWYNISLLLNLWQRTLSSFCFDLWLYASIHL